MHVKWNFKNLFVRFLFRKLSPLMMTTMMKQKGNQSKTIFSFVSFCMCSHKLFNTFSWHLSKYLKLSVLVCVKRHTFAMSLSVCVLCGIYYAGTGIKMCRIYFKKVIMNINICTSLKCAGFCTFRLIRTKFPRL